MAPSQTVFQREQCKEAAVVSYTFLMKFTLDISCHVSSSVWQR